MGESLGMVLVMGIITFGVYRIFELFVRRKERMAMIEKMQVNIEPQLLKDRLKLPLFGNPNMALFWSLRAGFLFAGVGLGLIIGFIIEVCLTGGLDPSRMNMDWESTRYIKNTLSIAYIACVFIFGGIGLLIAYLIEQKNIRKGELEN